MANTTSKFSKSTPTNKGSEYTVNEDTSYLPQYGPRDISFVSRMTAGPAMPAESKGATTTTAASSTPPVTSGSTTTASSSAPTVPPEELAEARKKMMDARQKLLDTINKTSEPSTVSQNELVATQLERDAAFDVINTVFVKCSEFLEDQSGTVETQLGRDQVAEELLQMIEKFQSEHSARVPTEKSKDKTEDSTDYAEEIDLF